ncbi:MAG: ABC transporter substrate-binding protein [Burkholderiales bacterium]|nr:ABC transporter substrate-binding protein [Burkholderiales bacterium]
MQLARLALAGVLAAALASGLAAAAHAADPRTVVDSAGRRVALPARVERVFAAGPPASVMVFAIAPGKLLGWTRAIRPAEAAFMPRRYAALPELGRLAGRGDTANVETVMALRPDVIIDVGSVADTYASLADRVQRTTGIPYLLFDGRFASMADTLRRIGAVTGDVAQAERLARYAERTLAEVRQRLAAVPAGGHPRVYYARGPAGLQTGLAGSINVEVLDVIGARNVAAGARGGLANVSLEQVLAWAPEVIITSDPLFFRAVPIDPRWAGVPRCGRGASISRRTCRSAGSTSRPARTA